ncbi:disulfide bond formation protein B [Roseomonas sp. HJA6]|uniref:Disulfide bond formation protein B n=1 Tax=Roseomonas alba TaxID=2846776 RepID=A0ABS7AFR6_9PROT|nr:disulfide bond formation protein B [Neoroseomonas alba]MBW6401142.1 disulfide bond formation protein B [Neoroseomonas alba]
MPYALLIAVLAIAAPLFAQASESWWGLAPCILCLWQRWPYRIAAVLAALGVVLPGRLRVALVALSGVSILVSGAIAALHVGVEQHWWPSPLPGCAAPTAGPATQSIDDMMRSLAVAPAKPCDEPTYLIPGLPVSMAAMNLLYALGLGGLALVFARRLARR